eukprot:3252253-Rhodomonas_salina.1
MRQSPARPRRHAATGLVVDGWGMAALRWWGREAQGETPGGGRSSFWVRSKCSLHFHDTALPYGSASLCLATPSRIYHVQ